MDSRTPKYCRGERLNAISRSVDKYEGVRTRSRSGSKGAIASASELGRRVFALEKIMKGEEEQESSCVIRKKVSPALERLQRMNEMNESRDAVVISTNPTGRSACSSTRGRFVTELQEELAKKHHESKSRVDELSVGGGVSLWPAMDNMRLNSWDVISLIAVCCILICAMVKGFFLLHGGTIEKLKHYSAVLEKFHMEHPVVINTDGNSLDSSLLKWHQDFSVLMTNLQSDLSHSWSKCDFLYILCVISYLGGIVILLYYLYDNVLATSRLTPKRIKQWVSLLVVVTTWTALGLGLLILAQRLETAVQMTVLRLGDELERLVYTSHDLTKYHSVLLLWTSRYLPPTSHGVLSILNVVQVQDVSYCLQYYSLPVLTAILTPIIKLLHSLKTVYSA